MTLDNNKAQFPKRLPSSRLGQSHSTLEAFCEAVQFTAHKSKEFTLVVVTDQKRILLGMKNRGFGEGMYNSFGGKFDSPEESVEACACRELEEETNIKIPLEEMKKCKVGIQRYSFQQDPVEMVMHVFRIDIHDKKCEIRQCDEITPEWFDDYHQIPLDNMFADDSLWLTELLSSSTPVLINGSYHFREDCQETNTILHYHMDVTCARKQAFSLEKRLFHAIHSNKVHSPSVKEFKECYAFLTAIRNSFKNANKQDFDIVIDVAGGHGALAALFLTCTSAYKAVVVDPARVGQNSVEKAWKRFYGDKQLLYREECLRTGLPQELKEALAVTTPDRILVVACHACQHLSEETLRIATRFGVHAAAMPCCQKDLTIGGSWKSTSKNLQIPVAKVMDLLLAGQMMALHNKYDVRMKCIDSKITPQNRVIICRRLAQDATNQRQTKIEDAYDKLEVAYAAAHATARSTPPKYEWSALRPNNAIYYTALGFAAGIFTAVSFSKR
jgi:8-oxo-dGTP pyrophosphatase MutT (NUDIX family)